MRDWWTSPLFRLYRNEEFVMEYPGPRDRLSLISFVQDVNQPSSVLVHKAKEIKNLMTSSTDKFFVSFAFNYERLQRAYKKIAEDMRPHGVHFYHINGPLKVGSSHTLKSCWFKLQCQPQFVNSVLLVWPVPGVGWPDWQDCHVRTWTERHSNIFWTRQNWTWSEVGALIKLQSLIVPLQELAGGVVFQTIWTENNIKPGAVWGRWRCRAVHHALLGQHDQVCQGREKGIYITAFYFNGPANLLYCNDQSLCSC